MLGKVVIYHDYYLERETRSNLEFKIGDSEIDLVDGYRYLGIFLMSS